MLIKIYVYKKPTGEYLYTDIGNPDSVIQDLSSDKDFTLTPPPIGQVSYWIDGVWHDKPKQTTAN